MATNEVYRDADRLYLPVPSGTESGDPVLIGAIPAVAITDRDADGNATVVRKGSWNIPVAGAIAAVGTAVYIDSSGDLTATASGNTLWGYSLATKGSGTASLHVTPARV